MLAALRRLALASVVVVGLAGVARAEGDLAGEWVHAIEGGEMKLSLRADGTFSFEGMEGRWKGDSKHLELAAATGESTTYDVRLEKDQLTLTGGDLGGAACVFSRKGGAPAKPAASPAPAKPETPSTEKPATPAPEGEKAVPDLSRRPQAVPKDLKKLEPKFSGKTRVVKAPTFEVTLPESWTFQEAQRGGVQILSANPGLAPTEILKQQITFWVYPVPLAEIDKGFQERVKAHASEADPLFQGNGLSLQRKKTEVLDAPGGLVARLDYEGTISNQFVQGQRATGLLAVSQRKMYDVAVTIVTLEGNSKDGTDDALAILDSIKCFLKDRDQELEKKIVGQWVVPSKTGNSFETYQFFEDGTYKWHYESSYSGSIKDSGGNETANWGTASQNDEAGRYEIRGDIIFFVSKRGEQGLRILAGQKDGKPAITIGSKTFVR